MNEEATKSVIQPTGEATGFIPAPGNNGKPITVIGTAAIRDAFDAKCIEQALNSRGAPGVTDLVLNPDAHAGYGAPVGCVLVSPTHVYPGPVGVDIKCSMSLLQLDLPVDAVADKAVRRALINAIVERTPTGAGKGQRNVTKGRTILLPGNPTAGSCVMVADPGADKSCYSVNHGAGRAKGRKAAIRELDQQTVDDEFVAHDILTNCRTYPKDEAPAAYKDFNEVLNSVRLAGLASEVARLKAR